MARGLFSTVILVSLLICGCAKAPPPVAGIVAAPPEAAAGWDLPAAVALNGEGNSCRVVTGGPLGAEPALELAAGGQGVLEYFREITAGPHVRFESRLQFLSTQGAGRVSLSAFTAEGRLVAKLGWVYTGPVPESDNLTRWLDKRYTANYQGGWIVAEGSPAELFAAGLPGAELDRAVKYRLSIEAGQGQHVLVTACRLAVQPAGTLKITPAAAGVDAVLGSAVELQVEIENTGAAALSAARIELREPYGYGVVALDDRVKLVEALAPGEKRRLSWQIRAQRPDAVNLGRPWPVGFSVDGTPVPAQVAVTVADPRPGTVYYVMTEDLEPIDSAGYPERWGNADGWLQPRELVVQMADKAEKINGIAGQYGARWTHYIALPVLKAAEWAAAQSAGGDWRQAVDRIKQSVRTQAALGHEYALHLHSDYDPYLPGNVLSYNPAVDGLWANHLRHGWAHSLPVEGELGDYASRTGFLYSYQRVLDELAVASPHGQIITARAGSFDFGSGPASEAMSTRAYRKVGLRAGSDADGNKGGITAGDYGREIYLAKPDDIGLPADDIATAGLIEFRPTPRDYICYDSQSAPVMNAKADRGMAAFAAGGSVKPGVHAIVGFTHVMFMMGEGGWQSTHGGQFTALDDHLRYLKERYVDRGLLTFGTAGELAKAYLDYYSPQPVVLYGPRRADNWGVAEYPVVLLGKDIPVDAAHPHTVALKYPLYLRDSAYRAVILKNGRPIYDTWGLPTPANDIVFGVDDRTAQYSVKIYHNKYLYKAAALVRALRNKI